MEAFILPIIIFSIFYIAYNMRKTIANIKYKYIKKRVKLGFWQKLFFRISLAVENKPYEVMEIIPIIRKYYILLANNKPKLEMINREIRREAQKKYYKMGLGENDKNTYVISTFWDTKSEFGKVMVVEEITYEFLKTSNSVTIRKPVCVLTMDDIA